MIKTIRIIKHATMATAFSIKPDRVKVGSDDSKEERAAKAKFNKWYAEVNKLAMDKIAKFLETTSDELTFDIDDLSDQLYRISFDDGVTAEAMAKIIFKDYKEEHTCLH